ncbi:MAG: low molecular weight protein arginine phosphatase [Bacilli bacterium]
MKLVFVCTGNTCRSPMAEKIAAQLAPEHWEITSCGVYVSAAESASRHAKTILHENGLSQEHSSKQLSRDLIFDATYIFTMTNAHRRTVITYFPEVESKTYSLCAWPERTEHHDVVDPYGGSIADYGETFAQLKLLITPIITQLIQAENMED